MRFRLGASAPYLRLALWSLSPSGSFYHKSSLESHHQAENDTNPSARDRTGGQGAWETLSSGQWGLFQQQHCVEPRSTPHPHRLSRAGELMPGSCHDFLNAGWGRDWGRLLCPTPPLSGLLCPALGPEVDPCLRCPWVPVPSPLQGVGQWGAGLLAAGMQDGHSRCHLSPNGMGPHVP